MSAAASSDVMRRLETPELGVPDLPGSRVGEASGGASHAALPCHLNPVDLKGVNARTDMGLSSKDLRSGFRRRCGQHVRPAAVDSGRTWIG